MLLLELLSYSSFSLFLGIMIHGTPSYRKGHYSLRLKEILKTIISEEVNENEVAHGIPSAIRESAVFVVKTSTDANILDLTADDNGAYAIRLCHRF